MQMNESRLKRSRARRAKAIAVKKYNAGDLAGAKEYAAKAKKLNPLLCGLLCLNAVLDVLIGFGKKTINGEVDWYSVLAVEPTADVATIKHRFYKLTVDIIVDSDNSVGNAMEAENILCESWKVLCNEKKRNAYDKRRVIQKEVQHMSLGTNSAASSSPSPSASSASSSSLSSASASATADSSFWTRCHSCSFKHRYQKRCKGQTFICARCREPFEANEYPAASMSGVNPWSYEKQPITRTSQVPSPSSNYTPVVFSESKPVAQPQRLFDPPRTVSEENERIYQQTPLSISGQVPSLTYTLVILSAPKPAARPRRLFDPPRMVREENEQMVHQQTPLGVSGNVKPTRRPSPGFLCGRKYFHPPQRFSKGKEPMAQPPLRISDQVPSLYAPVVMSATKPAQKPKMFNGQNEEMVEVNVEQSVILVPKHVEESRRVLDPPKIFNEDNEEIVDVMVEEMVEPPLQASGLVNQLRRLTEEMV